MSLIPIEDAKSFLDVIHDWDDAKLQALLDGAEDEALQFMGRDSWDDLAGDDPLPPASVVVGVMLLLQASYQAPPDDIPKLRQAAEVKLMPYRCGLGV